jgi:hypothetical protein
MVAWSRPPLPKGGSSAFIPRMRCRSTVCSTCSRTSIGPSLRRRTRNIPTRSRRRARPSVRFTTPKSSSAGSRWRWSSRRSSRSRDLPLRSFASNMSASRTSPISTRNANAARFRSATRSTPSRAASPRRRSSRPRCRSKRNIACLSSTTIQWSHSRRQRCGRATTALPCSTRRKDPRTAATTWPACSGCRAIKCACCRPTSEADLDPDYARNMSCRSPCWRRVRSSARCE